MSKIIDFHCHVFPDQRAKKILKYMTARSGVPFFEGGTPEDLAQDMDSSGIYKSVILPVSTNPKKADSINDFASGLCSYPQFVPFGSVHPEQENWKEAIKGFRSKGLRGLKIHNDYQDFMFDSKICMDIIDAAFCEGLIVVVHAGFDPVSPNVTRCTPKMIHDAMPLLTQGVFVAAHMGGYQMLDESLKYVLGSDIYIDTSMMPHCYSIDRYKEAILFHNPDRILFGTDSPWDNPRKAADVILSMNLHPDITDKILYKNAERLLK